MTALTVAGVIVAVLLGSTALAVLFGKSIRRADEQLTREVDQLSARRGQQ